MTSQERSLADVAGSESIDSSPAVTPEDFSIEDFIAGIRPTRRAIQIFARADLIARLDEIATRIDAAEKTSNVDALIDEFQSVKAEFQAGTWFELEKRSSEWVKEFRLAKESALGYSRAVRGDDDQATLTDEEVGEISLHQLAEQIVTPSGVTVDHLRTMLDVNEGEVAKLLAVMVNVNNELAQQAKVLTRDFSRRRSTHPATQDS